MSEYKVIRITTSLAPARGTLTIRDVYTQMAFDVPVEDTKLYNLGDRVLFDVVKAPYEGIGVMTEGDKHESE